ncbi:hypothetical protein SLS58_009203 [Diplodia intermedia]|uniref:Uncharacterized protein n=1 Tax=Diplodia intermedia TaxID=856260 RepID=A0ABR3TDQ2_9PEZI
MQIAGAIAIALFTFIGTGLALYAAAHLLNRLFPNASHPSYELNRAPNDRRTIRTAAGGVDIELSVIPRGGDGNIRLPPRAVSRGRDPRPMPFRAPPPPEYDCEAGLEHPPPVYSVEPGE